MKKIIAPVLLSALLPTVACAYNGLLLTGYGTESVLMGGADVAVSRTGFAANSNPAGLAQISGQAWDFEIVPWYVPEYSHSDDIGNYRKRLDNDYGVYGNVAYAQRSENSPFAAGISLVVQGGVGWEYKDLNTVFGTRDEASALFSIIRLSPAVAWKVNDRLRLGVTLGINYFIGHQELFPNTSTTEFSGFSFKDASGIGLNSKWGLQYEVANDVIIAAAFGTRTSIGMKGGTMKFNYTNSIPGEGVVNYRNAEMIGFHLPEELAIGISFRLTPRLLVSLQEKWYNWSDALRTLDLVATNPDSAGVPQTVRIPSSPKFNDQYVYEAGFAYDYSHDTVIMGGINYGSNPVPRESLSSIFQPIQSMHYMLGISHNVDKEWKVTGGIEWYLPRSASYSNPVFGSNVRVHSSGIIAHLSIGRNW